MHVHISTFGETSSHVYNDILKQANQTNSKDFLSSFVYNFEQRTSKALDVASTFKAAVDPTWEKPFWLADAVNFLAALIYLKSFHCHYQGRPKAFVGYFYIGFAVDEIVHLVASRFNQRGEIVYEAIDLSVQLFARVVLMGVCAYGLIRQRFSKTAIISLFLFFLTDVIGNLSMFVACVVENKVSYLQSSAHNVVFMKFLFDSDSGRVLWQTTWWSTTLFLGCLYEYVYASDRQSEHSFSRKGFADKSNTEASTSWTTTYIVLVAVLFIGAAFNAVVNVTLIVESTQYFNGDKSICRA